MNTVYQDIGGNKYYVEKDKLYVEIVRLQIKRLIGILTYNLNTNKANITINRKSSEKYKLGWLISAGVFEMIDIDKVTIIEDNRILYQLDWASVKHNKQKWSFNPSNGFEKQIIVPYKNFKLLGDINAPIIATK